MLLDELNMEEPVLIDDERWESLLAATGGAFAPCFQCGVCTAICPWGLVREESISIRGLIRAAQLGVDDLHEALWLCTACGQCEMLCPRGVPIVEGIRGLRYALWQSLQVDEGLPSALWSLYWNNNPLHQPPSERMAWTGDLEVESYDADVHEICLYIGCAASYERRGQRTARALVRIFNAAEVSYGVLGEMEPCCGESALSFGHKPFFQELAIKAAQIFRDRGVKKMVVLSPHCLDVFMNEYPKVSAAFEPIHYSAYLAQLISEGRLRLDGMRDRRVAIQDPCLLARKAGGTTAPREVLGAIAGIRLIELSTSREDTLCCGGGGGRMWMETPVGERFADLRIKDASTQDVDILGTVCPYCTTCLEDSLNGLEGTELQVQDLAEIVLDALLSTSCHHDQGEGQN